MTGIPTGGINSRGPVEQNSKTSNVDNAELKRLAKANQKSAGVSEVSRTSRVAKAKEAMSTGLRAVKNFLGIKSTSGAVSNTNIAKTTAHALNSGQPIRAQSKSEGLVPRFGPTSKETSEIKKEAEKHKQSTTDFDVLDSLTSQPKPTSQERSSRPVARPLATPGQRSNSNAMTPKELNSSRPVARPLATPGQRSNYDAMSEKKLKEGWDEINDAPPSSDLPPADLPPVWSDDLLLKGDNSSTDLPPSDLPPPLPDDAYDGPIDLPPPLPDDLSQEELPATTEPSEVIGGEVVNQSENKDANTMTGEEFLSKSSTSADVLVTDAVNVETPEQESAKMKKLTDKVDDYTSKMADSRAQLEKAEKRQANMEDKIKTFKSIGLSTKSTQVKLAENEIQITKLKVDHNAFQRQLRHAKFEFETMKAPHMKESLADSHKSDMESLRKEGGLLEASNKLAQLKFERIKNLYGIEKMSERQIATNAAKIAKEEAILAQDQEKIKEADAVIKQINFSFASQEIITSENSYIASLTSFDKILDEIVNSPLTTPDLQAGSKALKAHIEEAKKFQNKMLESQEEGKTTPQSIINLYANDELNKGYAQTIKEYETVLTNLQAIKNLDLSKVYPKLNQAQIAEIRKITDNAPIMPVQRIMRHDMLMQAVIPNVPEQNKEDFTTILESIQKASRFVNS